METTVLDAIITYAFIQTVILAFIVVWCTIEDKWLQGHKKRNSKPPRASKGQS